MQDQRARAESPDPPNRQARLEQALEKKHGWKRVDEDPEEAAATAAAVAGVRIGTAVTVPSRQVETVTVVWYHAPRPREHRPRTARRTSSSSRTARRTSSSSRTSSADPGSDSEDAEPGEAGLKRLCAGGCGSDISHKRPNAKTCGSDRCKKRVQRSAIRSSWVDLAGEIQQVENRIEELLVERQEKWRTAARNGGRRFLTSVPADELQKQFARQAALLAQYVRTRTQRSRALDTTSIAGRRSSSTATASSAGAGSWRRLAAGRRLSTHCRRRGARRRRLAAGRP